MEGGAEGGGPFGLHNLPWGVFSLPGEAPRVGVRWGEAVVDVEPLLGEMAPGAFTAGSLNPFMALGPSAWHEARSRLIDLLIDARRADEVAAHLLPLDRVHLHLPVEVADYVDFYCSEEHASNLGRIFRPDEEPLKPNWRHLPVGYHGRSGTVAVSGTPVRRPCGQRRGADGPVFGPSARLDLEVEVGFVVGVGSEMGRPVPVSAFADHVFGVVLVNDWSARDIQAWEYVPLGPFLGKSFLTSISPWVVPLEALGTARVPGPPQDPEPLAYLRRGEPWGLDLHLEVELCGQVVSRPPFGGLYWTPDQMLAHMTVNGASLRTGDLFASGTVSGPAADQRGSLIELSWNGAQPVRLADGSRRSFLEDGDTVTISGSAPGPDGAVIGLGSVTGRVEGHSS